MVDYLYVLFLIAWHFDSLGMKAKRSLVLEECVCYVRYYLEIDKIRVSGTCLLEDLKVHFTTYNKMGNEIDLINVVWFTVYTINHYILHEVLPQFGCLLSCIFHIFTIEIIYIITWNPKIGSIKIQLF